MCGITGCLALADGAGPDTEWVGRAAMRIAHRGPDDEGSFADHDLALGFRRLDHEMRHTLLERADNDVR